MARGKPVEVDHLKFATQAEATDHFKQMLARCEEDGVGGLDEIDLRALLGRHPEAAQKSGSGVKRFFVKPDEWGGRCFWLERTDGTETDFSYISCISGKAPTPKQKFAEACRSAVGEDLRAAKVNHFNQHGDENRRVRCEVTGELVTIDESHLDHMPPMTMQVIVETFLAAQDLVLSETLFEPPKDRQLSTNFADESLAKAFREFHHRVGKQLRIVKARSNLAASSRNRIRHAKNPVKVGK